MKKTKVMYDETYQGGRSEGLALPEAKRFLETNKSPMKREDPSSREDRAQKRAKSRFETGAVAISRAVAAYLDQQMRGVSKQEVMNSLSCLYSGRRVGDVLNALYGAGVITSAKKDIKFAYDRRQHTTFVVPDFLPMPEFADGDNDPLDTIFDTRSDI